MKKEIIRDKIFSKRFEGIRTSIPVSDLPKDILSTDSLDIEKVEGYYSEKNSVYMMSQNKLLKSLN